MQNIVLLLLQCPVIFVHLDNDLISLRFNLGSLLLDDIDEELLLKSLDRHGEIDDGHLNTDLGSVMGVSHLGCHEQSEAIIVVLNRIAQLNLLDTTVSDELLFEEEGVNGGIDRFLDVLDEHGLTIAYAAADLTEEVGGLEEAVDCVVLSLELLLDPAVGLLLRINTETPSFSHGYHDTVLSGRLIGWKSVHLPSSNGNWVSHYCSQAESVSAWNVSFLSLNCPCVCKLLSVITSESSIVSNTCAREENVSDEIIYLDLDPLDSFFPPDSFVGKKDDQGLSTSKLGSASFDCGFERRKLIPLVIEIVSESLNFCQYGIQLVCLFLQLSFGISSNGLHFLQSVHLWLDFLHEFLIPRRGKSPRVERTSALG